MSKKLKELPLAEKGDNTDFDELIKDTSSNKHQKTLLSNESEKHIMDIDIIKDEHIKIKDNKVKFKDKGSGLIKSKDEIFILDGQKVSLSFSDLDGDGRASADIVERLPSSLRNETQVIQPTELGETLKELNKDEVEQDSRMSSIDLKARLADMEVGAILVYDTLIAMKFLPDNALFLTRQRKRLSVSEGGKGRAETVDIVRGVKDQQQKIGAIDKFMGAFGGKKS